MRPPRREEVGLKEGHAPAAPGAGISLLGGREGGSVRSLQAKRRYIRQVLLNLYIIYI